MVPLTTPRSLLGSLQHLVKNSFRGSSLFLFQGVVVELSLHLPLISRMFRIRFSVILERTFFFWLRPLMRPLFFLVLGVSRSHRAVILLSRTLRPLRSLSSCPNNRIESNPHSSNHVFFFPSLTIWLAQIFPRAGEI